ncbi:uncharacterized protein LOC144018535 [Festucalex cinctus]
MPIASGASGRVDVGSPDGARTAAKYDRNCDSYLQRYLEKKKKNKSNLTEDTEGSADHSSHDSEEQHKTDDIEDKIRSQAPVALALSLAQPTKKSHFCVVL